MPPVTDDRERETERDGNSEERDERYRENDGEMKEAGTEIERERR